MTVKNIILQKDRENQLARHSKRAKEFYLKKDGSTFNEVNINLLDLRVVKEREIKYRIKPGTKIISPKGIYDICELFEIGDRAEEVFYIICLDTQNHISSINEVSKGNLNSSIVHPREVFKRALLSNSSSIILIHNHPSGNPKPSKEDINITKRLEDAGDILGIRVLDHLIIGDGNYVSLKEMDIL